MLAISMVRDEADIIRSTVLLLLEQGCRVVIADNGSVDATRDVLADLPVLIVDDPDPAYNQAAKMTALAAAHAESGEWVVPFDADEHWHHLHLLTDAHDVALAAPHVHIGSESIGPEPFPKVAFRWQPGVTIDMGNHGCNGAGHRILRGLEVCHHQYRSLEQVRRKVRNGTEAYSHTTLPPVFGSHWRALAALTDEQLEKWWVDYCNQRTTLCPLSPL